MQDNEVKETNSKQEKEDEKESPAAHKIASILATKLEGTNDKDNTDAEAL